MQNNVLFGITLMVITTFMFSSMDGVSRYLAENNNIFTHKHGYPQFYTQIFFIKGEKEVFMKTVLNNEECISKISNCKNVIR